MANTSFTVVTETQAVYISQFGSDIGGNGTLSFPYATYEHARAAVAPFASAGNQFSITSVGQCNIAGNLTLSPFVNISGLGSDSSSFAIGGQVLLSAAFATTANSTCQISDCAINAAGNINLTFTVFQSSIIRFNNVDFLSTPSLNFVGPGTNVSTETILIDNCIASDQIQDYSFTNVSGVIKCSSASGTIISINNSAVSNSSLLLSNIVGLCGDITLRTTAAGTLSGLIESCFPYGSTLTLDGLNNTLLIDSTSYIPTPAYLNGAVLADITITSLSDGVNANTNFTPTNYTPVGTATYKSGSVTGNLAGIDAALASVLGGIWIDQTATPVTMVANKSYSANTAGLLTFNMPAAAAFGDVFEIGGNGAGGWILQMNAGQTAHLGNAATTVAGSFASNNRYDCVKLLCTVANTTFTVISSMGNITNA